MIWPLVHILPRSSFLPDQRGKPTIHLLSSTSLLNPSRPLSDPKTFFLSSPVKCNPQGLDFLNRRPSSLTAPEAKELLHPLARSGRDRRRVSLGSVVGDQERTARRLAGLSSRSQEPGGALSSEPGSRGAVQSSAASQAPQGNPAASFTTPDPWRLPFLSLTKMSFASHRSKAELLRASPLSPCRSRSSPLLCFRGHTKCFCESLGPQAERADDIQHHAPRSCCVARKSDLV